MNERFSRTELLFGKEKIHRLADSRVAVFGIGGVGGYVVEALARSGIGSLDLIDRDVVSVSNINRQIIALDSTVGQYKAEAAAQRARDINPEIKVQTYNTFFTPENADSFDFSQYDYIVDAVDTVSAKTELIVRAEKAGVPIISSMGAGNKLDPTAFEIADIYKTSVCPLARVMRRELKARGIKKLTVVYSKEEPKKIFPPVIDEASGKAVPASYACVPSVVGLIIASRVIRDLTAASCRPPVRGER
ncbi:MAG: tRNA threonylcarbamoyladenosine dehydratase [Clostridia bacterium]|nr:tRNA threonylcarbamoyladenosine dehydratase [Clostridia bacterium]